MKVLKNLFQLTVGVYSFIIRFIKRKIEIRNYRLTRNELNLRFKPTADELFEKPFVFILSTGRCGTTLLTKILNKSNSTLVEHSPKPELEFVSSIVYKKKPSIEILKYSVLSARFDNYFYESFIRNKIYVETNNRVSSFAPALANLFPNSKFIHIIRHPGDFVRSGIRRGYYSNEKIQYQRLDYSDREFWNKFNQLEKVAFEWNLINSYIEDFKKELEKERSLTLTSEELFNGLNNNIIDQIWDFLEIDNPFKNYGNKLQKIYKKPVNKQEEGEFPKYDEWKESDQKSLKNIATLYQKYGYKL